MLTEFVLKIAEALTRSDPRNEPFRSFQTSILADTQWRTDVRCVASVLGVDKEEFYDACGWTDGSRLPPTEAGMQFAKETARRHGDLLERLNEGDEMGKPQDEKQFAVEVVVTHHVIVSASDELDALALASSQVGQEGVRNAISCTSTIMGEVNGDPIRVSQAPVRVRP